MSIAKIRREIDSVDVDIQRLLNQRAELAKQIADEKTKVGGDNDLYRPEREAQILRKIISRNRGPLSNEAIRHLFRELISACRSLEQKIKVVYLGPEGTFTQSAVIKHFGSFVETEPLNSINSIFHKVELGSFPYGVVPVENSTEGMVTSTLDQFVNSSAKICGEVEVNIHHNLMSVYDSAKKIKRIYAHQQSLMQCRQWLDSNLRNALQIPVSSNAEGARMAKNTEGAAAIAGEITAEVYGLNIIAKNIEDEARNATRFFVIGRKIFKPSGNDKTSLLLTTGNYYGSLYELLEPFSRYKISMTKIESRPSRRTNWEYVFFVDIEGHKDDEVVKKALEELDQKGNIISVLGSYPKVT